MWAMQRGMESIPSSRGILTFVKLRAVNNISVTLEINGSSDTTIPFLIQVQMRHYQ